MKDEIHCRTDMSQMDICASLIHEMAHATLHSKGKAVEKEDDSMTDRQVKEVEAEATAYSVSRYFGMDTALHTPYRATSEWTQRFAAHRISRCTTGRASRKR